MTLKQDKFWESYLIYIDHLKEKYGKVPYSYFCNRDYKSRDTRNSRSKECLQIHHIYENLYAKLSDPKVCIRNCYNFVYQEPHNLVYCDMVEHYIIHLMIQYISKCWNGGCGFLYKDISDILNDYPFKSEYKKRRAKLLLDRYGREFLQHLLDEDNNFKGYLMNENK